MAVCQKTAIAASRCSGAPTEKYSQITGIGAATKTCQLALSLGVYGVTTPAVALARACTTQGL